MDRSQFILSFVSIITLTLIVSTHLKEFGSPADCVVSEWNQWSDCSQSCGESGSRLRSRVIFQDADCGGTCPYDVEETESCNRKCCPVDCAFTYWTRWGSCICTEDRCEGDGIRYRCSRRRQKLIDAACGGYCDEQTRQATCGYLCCYANCLVGWWTAWTECAAPCDQPGIKKRTRPIIRDSACGGRPCDHTEESATCTGKCCPVHCVLGEWGDWSKCNTTCGQAIQMRERFVQLPKCDGEPCTEEPHRHENKTCTNYVNVDCELSSWTEWSSCYLDNGFCGEGTKFRTRSILTLPSCNGQVCGNLTETRVCYGPCCRKDCKVTAWSEWSFCSSTCGQGVRATDANDFYEVNVLTVIMDANHTVGWEAE